LLYQHSTCVELSPVGSSNVYVASPYHNLTQMLLDLLGVPQLRGAGGGPVQLWRRLFCRRRRAPFSSFPTSCWRPTKTTSGQRIPRGRHPNAKRGHLDALPHGGYPLQSCFINDLPGQRQDSDQGRRARTREAGASCVMAGTCDWRPSANWCSRRRHHAARAGWTRCVGHFSGREDLR